MKKTLLTIFLSAASFFTVSAQDPYTLTLFDDVIFYGMYEATVNEPIPAGAIRHTNSSYAKKLTPQQIASFGNTLTMTVKLNPRCDNYDRIGNVNLAFVPKGQTTYEYDEVERIEIGRFITPFMHLQIAPFEVPYTFQVDNLTRIFHDNNTAWNYDFWIEFEVYGYQGGPGQGGAAEEIAICNGRNDVYQGTLEFTSTNNGTTPAGYNYYKPLSHKLELKNYDLSGTDVIGQTTKSITFDVPLDVENAKLYFINSNHGSNADGEEYNRRTHIIKMDGVTKLTYVPGGVSCVPYSQYNTQPNCIYLVCDPNGAYPRPDNDLYWGWNNWCPGNKIPIRVIDLGTLAAGSHTFNISVPDAVFNQGQGYFPMSVYLQGNTATMATEEFVQTNFTLSPNPVTDITTIVSVQTVEAVTVFNSLGQKVWAGNSKNIDLTGLQQGVYMAQVTFEGNRTATQKIVKN